MKNQNKLFVCSYNILFGQYDEVFDSISKLFKIAEKYDKYIICLQEARNTKSHYKDIINKICKLTPQDCKVVSLMNQYFSNDKLGIITLTNANILTTQKSILSKRPYSIIKILNNPLFGAISLLLEINMKQYNVINCHLDFYNKTLNMIHMKEIYDLSLKEENADGKIIVGDFNTFSLKSNYKKIKKRVNEVFTDYEFDKNLNHFTHSLNNYFNRDVPGRKIFEIINKMGLHFPQKSDWIIFENLKPHESKILYDFIGSDHFPIYTVFDI